eukprot:9749806-Alexandrium_andersonii.AAC.1
MKSQSARAFRVICGTQKGDCRSTHDRTDFQIFSTVGALHTETVLISNRLSYLARLRTPGGELEALLQGITVWQNQTQTDLADLATSSTKLSELPPPDMSMTEW